jgi:polar amino acid transport system permease protein
VAFDAGTFWNALFSAAFARGALVTLTLAICSHALAILLSIPLALVLERGTNRVLVALVKLYVWLFRGAPTLLQLLFVWNALPQLLPALREPWFTPFIAGLLALSLNEAAYQVEINRAALRSVDAGQAQAGAALGLRRWQVLRLVVLPQAMRVAVPPTANEFITLLKVTSLASVISLQELMAVTSQTVATTFRFSEYYAVALCWYLAMVGVLTLLQARLERRFAWHGAITGQRV